MGFGLRLGPVRINKRGISVGGGVGIGPIGVGGGVRVSKFGRRRVSSTSNVNGFVVIIEGLRFIFRPIDKLLKKFESKTKRFYKNFKINKYVLFFVCLFFGFFGLHRFLTGKIRTGIYYYFSSGGLLIGYFYDLIKIIRNQYTDVWDRKIEGHAFNFIFESYLVKTFKSFSRIRQFIFLFVCLAQLSNIINMIQGENRIAGLIISGIAMYFAWTFKRKKTTKK